MNLSLKKLLFVFLVGGIGGVVINNLLLPAFIEADFLGSANVLNVLVKPQIQTVIKTNEKTVVIEPDFWKDVVSQSKDSVVLTQTFTRGRLIAQGSGIVLTTDGLIATSLNNTPFASSVYQVYFGDNILKGTVVLRDFENNLALIAVEEGGLPVLDFADADSLVLGQTNLIVGKNIRNQGLSVFAQLSFVKEILPEVFFIDTNISKELIGSALLSSSGKLIGLVQLNRKNEIFVSPPESLINLIDEYSKLNKDQEGVSD